MRRKWTNADLRPLKGNIMTIKEFFKDNKKAALAFSGGTDSSFLLYAGRKFGCDLKPYFIKTAFQPQFELADAQKLCDDLHVPLTVIDYDILSQRDVSSNPQDRCYYCKRILFSTLTQRASEDGYSLLIDGTNASDDPADRPGMRALRELSVRSPLLECDISKAEVRMLSRAAGLFTWNKPSYACLATRIKTGTAIRAKTLQAIEWSEDALREMGFSDFRIRVTGNTAKLQLPTNQMNHAVNLQEKIIQILSAHFDEIVLDLVPRKGE